MCADQPNGTGVRTCAGPVATGSALDTAIAGREDLPRDHDRRRRQRRHHDPPLPRRRAPTARAPDFTLAFDFSRATTSTRFTRLLVKEAPRGATLEVTCRGRSCPTRRVRGAAPPATFTQRIGTRAITLRPWIPHGRCARARSSR